LFTFVRCTKGTYVRTLAEDLGQLLGCGAHLADLRRTSAEPFSVEDAHSLARILSAPPEPGGIVPFLIPFHKLRQGLDSMA
jgi:tRNA pseudouridine55 synthase